LTFSDDPAIWSGLSRWQGGTGETAARAVEPARHRVLGARSGDVADAKDALVASWAEPQGATIAQTETAGR